MCWDWCALLVGQRGVEDNVEGFETRGLEQAVVEGRARWWRYSRYGLSIDVEPMERALTPVLGRSAQKAAAWRLGNLDGGTVQHLQ